MIEIENKRKDVFLKRFKSILKIAINSLALVVNILLKDSKDQEKAKILGLQIKIIADSFNTNYHSNINFFTCESLK